MTNIMTILYTQNYKKVKFLIYLVIKVLEIQILKYIDIDRIILPHNSKIIINRLNKILRN